MQIWIDIRIALVDYPSKFAIFSILNSCKTTYDSHIMHNDRINVWGFVRTERFIVKS